MKSQISVCVLGFLCYQFIGLSDNAIVNQNVDRVVDVSRQVVKETLKLTAQDDAGKPFKQYTLVIPKEWFPLLAFFSARNSAKKSLTVRQAKLVEEGVELIVYFPTSFNSQIFFVEFVYTGLIKPYPEYIKQSEKQFVKYTGFIHFYSPYVTIKQKTQFRLSSANVVFYTQLKPYNFVSSKIKYGPFEKVAGKKWKNIIF